MRAKKGRNRGAAGARLAVLAALATSPAPLLADDFDTEEVSAEEPGPVDDIADVPLEDLLDFQTDVATRGTKQAVRESPGIVTVITREEIQRSGARDLVEVLRLVPGFQFGTDTYNAVFAGVRGLWAADGKVLILLDGHDLNDIAYTSTPLGNRVPLDWISRIEIIRGPGSVMYGGSAAYAVINIVTRSGEELNGGGVSGSWGQMLDGVIHHDRGVLDTISLATLSASYGQVYRRADDFTLVLNAFGGVGMRSDQPYTDVYGDRFEMAGNSDTDPLMVNAKATWKGLSVRYLFERYALRSRDGYGENFDEALPVLFLTSSEGISYDWKIAKNVTLTPQVKHTYQKPWATTSENAWKYEQTYWNFQIHRVEAGLDLSVDVTSWFNLLVGGGYRFDWAKNTPYGFPPDPCDVTSEQRRDPDGCKETETYHDWTAYAQAVFVTKVLDISVGGRYEQSNRFDYSIVPRGALTKAYGPFHFKALASQAYRPPSIMIMTSPDVKPEKTTVFELELGYQFTSYLFLVANGFYMWVDDPIVYYYDNDTNQEGYRNYKTTGTAGCEAELKFKLDRHFINLNYSFYHPAGRNKVESFAVPDHSDVLLAFAQHKIAINSGVELVRDLTLNISGSILLGDRFGYVSVNADEESVLRRFDPELILNANLLYRNIGVEGLWLMIGGRNLTNSQVRYIQAYDNWHAPLPGASAEVFLKAGYDFQVD